MKWNEGRGLLVTGTDTGIGKTWVSALLVKEFRKGGSATVGLKPVSSGSREDAERLWEASGGALDIDVINPWWFQTPVAPLVAKRIEGRELPMESLVEHIHQVQMPTTLRLSKESVVGRFRSVRGIPFPITPKR